MSEYRLSTEAHSGFGGAVIRTAHPRLATAVASLGVGLLLLAITPRIGFLEEADRKWFGFVAGKGDAVIGKGTLENPRKTEQLGVPGELPASGVLVLDDEQGDYFEAMPPVPTDLAVVLARLKAMGVEHFSVGYPLDWKDPDTLAIEAMRAMMDRLDGMVLGYQLNNGTIGEPVPVPFQKCSISYADVGGDRSKLPVVNSLPGDLPEFGGDRTRAGFTVLGNEDWETERAYLLARWDDRVVFALPLAAAIVRLEVPLDEIEIEAGNEIRLGPEGPRIPIDFRGRIRLPKDEPKVMKVSATAMISRTLPEGFGEGGAPVYLLDARLGIGKLEREWAEALPVVDEGIRNAPRRLGVKSVPRPSPLVEMIALVAVALVGSWMLRGESVVRRLIQALVICSAVAVLLGVFIRFFSVAPVPLAFQMVPVMGLLMVLLTEGGGRIEVVRAKPEPRSEEAVSKPRSKKKRRKR